MTSPQRKKFPTIQDWSKFLDSSRDIGKINFSELRQACYSDIEKYRQRPLLVYATKFVGKPPNEKEIPNSIDLRDVEGFTDMVNSIPCNQNAIDVLIHSHGGEAAATERIVSILRNRFEDISFLIPHSAYSAATMLALSGNSIILHPSATLGPIDPQINGIPAKSIKKGFEKIKKQIAKEGPESLPAYIPLIEKYSISLLELCEDSEKLAKELVFNWIRKYMFENQKGMTAKIKKAVNYFSDYNKHLLHARPLSFKKLQELDLNIELADENLQELLWEAYILLNGFFNITPFVKLFETTNGISLVVSSEKYV